MEAQPYGELSDLSLMALCCYREARGETIFGKRAVCHVIKNRASQPGWWGHDIQSVVLKPWQFSSFNPNDPNSTVWPADDSPSWTDSLSAASAVLIGEDQDSTDGATFYHDLSMGWPKAWGKESDYVNTLNIGRLRFYRPVNPL
jgi:spore germination cell wall hydrolase CwlJ-like protein